MYTTTGTDLMVLPARAEVVLATEPLPRQWTFIQAIKAACLGRWRGTRSLGPNVSQLKSVVGWLNSQGATEFRHLTAEMYAELIEHHEALGYSPSTIQRKMAIFQGLCTDAVNSGMWKPTFRISVPRAPAEHTWWLEPEVGEKLYPWLRSHADADMVEMADLVEWITLTGIRVEETLRLERWHIIGGKKPKVRVPGTKTASSLRVVTLGERALALAERVLARRPSEGSSKLFPQAYLWYHRRWVLCREFIGEKDTHTCTLKSLRRTYAATVTDNGMPLAVLSEQLGHTDIRTTQRYLRLTGGFLGEAARKWLA